MMTNINDYKKNKKAELRKEFKELDKITITSDDDLAALQRLTDRKYNTEAKVSDELLQKNDEMKRAKLLEAAGRQLDILNKMEKLN